MSRSIHTTRRSLNELLARHASAQGADFEKRLTKAFQERYRKRTIKRLVHAERERAREPLGVTVTESCLIEVLDESGLVYHGANETDIRSVLALLPAAATEGISRIQLSLGKATQEEYVRREPEDERVCDPFTERPGAELFPGVFCGRILGRFSDRTGLITIFSFVLDEKRIFLPRPALHLYLRLHALKTLVHEIAHHHDATRRVARGRWLSDRRENAENYAERMEFDWALQCVIPYLESAYADQVSALTEWVEKHGGIRLPLSFFAGDPRRTMRDGMIRLIYSTSAAFESWLEEFPSYQGVAASRLGLAREIHYSGKYDECLSITDAVLADEPSSILARTLKADTLVHLDRLDEADLVIETVLKENPAHEPGLEVRGDILERRADWIGLLANSETWLQRAAPGSRLRREALVQRAVAYYALGNVTEFEKTLNEIENVRPLKNPAAFKRMLVRRAGRKKAQETETSPIPFK